MARSDSTTTGPGGAQKAPRRVREKSVWRHGELARKLDVAELMARPTVIPQRAAHVFPEPDRVDVLGYHRHGNTRRHPESFGDAYQPRENWKARGHQSSSPLQEEPLDREDKSIFDAGPGFSPDTPWPLFGIVVSLTVKAKGRARAVEILDETMRKACLRGRPAAERDEVRRRILAMIDDAARGPGEVRHAC